MGVGVIAWASKGVCGRGSLDYCCKVCVCVCVCVCMCMCVHDCVGVEVWV